MDMQNIEEKINAKVINDREMMKGIEDFKRGVEHEDSILAWYEELVDVGRQDLDQYMTSEMVEEHKKLLKYYKERLDSYNQKINESTYLFDVKIGDLLYAMGKKLDRDYGENEKFEKSLIFDIECYERENVAEEYPEDVYIEFSQVLHMGYETKHPKKQVLLPVISLGERPYMMGEEYIKKEETINLLDECLIGAKNNEFASEDWQDVFWNVYRDNLRDLIFKKTSQAKNIEEYNECVESILRY